MAHDYKPKAPANLTPRPLFEPRTEAVTDLSAIRLRMAQIEELENHGGPDLTIPAINLSAAYTALFQHKTQDVSREDLEFAIAFAGLVERDLAQQPKNIASANHQTLAHEALIDRQQNWTQAAIDTMTGNTLGDVAGRTVMQTWLEHQASIDQTGIGTIGGTGNDMLNAGKNHDCTTIILQVLRQAFQAAGIAWRPIIESATELSASRGKGLSGVCIASAES